MKSITAHLFVSLIARLACAGALVSSLSGCGGSQVESSGSTGVPKGQTTTTTTAVASPDKPAASAVATAQNVTPPPSDSPPSPFHIVAEAPYELQLRRIGKSAMFMADFEFLQIQGNKVAFDPNFALTKEVRGDGMTGAFESLLGSLPNALYASVVRPSGRTGFTEIYKWTGTKWISDYASKETISVLDIQPWLNGTLLVVEQHSLMGRYQFSVWPKSAKVFVPEPHEIKWDASMDFCSLGFIPKTLRTLPSGHAFMIGDSCTVDNGKEKEAVGIKRWSATDSKGTLDVLPEGGHPGFAVVDLVLHNEKDAYVAANMTSERKGPPKSFDSTPYLAHFDGKSWTQDTLPFSDGISGIEVDSQGTVWLASLKGELYSRTAGGKWVPVTLPFAGEDRKPIRALNIWSRAPGDEWVLGADGKRYFALHTGPAVEKTVLPNHQAMSDIVDELDMPTPLTWHCMTPFVLIYTLSKVAPPDFDYPATRDALKGHTEFADASFIEFKRLDKRYMGAIVTDVQMGKNLVELVKKKVPNSTPQLACHSPKPSRQLDFGLTPKK